MRVIACLLIIASSLLAQTSQEFHRRYGEPDTERFTARPGIALTVQYGSDGLACQVVLEPPQPLLNQENNALFMSSDTVTEVLEDVVPLASRGNEIGSFTTKSGCNELHVTDYLDLSITRSTHNCRPLKPEREMRATVSFKRDTCQSQRK
jgi:hypothetical protein